MCVCGAPTQNVQYAVPDDQADDVCRGPRTSKVVWINTTGTPTTEGATVSGGRQCPWREAPVVDPDTGDLDYGLFCAEHANPSNGMRNFDNILYAWLAIFQIITQTDWVFMAYDTMVGGAGAEAAGQCECAKEEQCGGQQVLCLGREKGQKVVMGEAGLTWGTCAGM